MWVCVWLCSMFEILPPISWVIMQFPEKVKGGTVSGVAISIGLESNKPGLCTLKYLPCVSCFSSMKHMIETTFFLQRIGIFKRLHCRTQCLPYIKHLVIQKRLSLKYNFFFIFFSFHTGELQMSLFYYLKINLL